MGAAVTWLHRQDPPSPPRITAHVDLQTLMLHASQVPPGTSPAADYLLAHAPKTTTDRWGELLPLSDVDQARLDRMWAVISSPLPRCRALLRSGSLSPSEVETLKAVSLESWQTLAQEAYQEMLSSKPPYPRWVQGVLDVLFGVPSQQVFTTGSTGSAGQKPEAGDARVSGGNAAAGTQADRLETSVRDEKKGNP